MTRIFNRRKGQPQTLLRIDITGLAVVLGVTIAAYLFGVSPALARRESLTKQYAVLNARKQEAVETQHTLKALHREIDHLRETLAQQPITLLSAQQSNERMDDLSRLMAEHGLVVHEVANGPGTTSRRFQLVPISVSGRGTFQHCSAFLHDLHARFRDMSAWKIELLNNPGENDGSIEFRFEFIWYAAPSASVATK